MLMRQAQEMQKKMQKIQEDLGNSEYEGVAGGGMVKVVITGSGLAKKVVLDASLVNASEKEILEDLIVAAFNDARKKADDSSNESIRAATNGIPLPTGLKF